MKYYAKIDNGEFIPIEGFFVQTGNHQPIPQGRYLTLHLPVESYFEGNTFPYFESLVNEKSVHKIEVFGSITSEEKNLIPSNLSIKIDDKLGYIVSLIVENEMELFNTQLSSSAPPQMNPTTHGLIYQVQFFHPNKEE